MASCQHYGPLLGKNRDILNKRPENPPYGMENQMATQNGTGNCKSSFQACMEFRLKIFLAFGGREWKSRKENGHDHTRENYLEAMIGINCSIPL